MFVYPNPLPQNEQIKVAKLLGVILSERLHFDDHVLAVLKTVLSENVFIEALDSPWLSTTHPIKHRIPGFNIEQSKVIP